MMIPNIRDIDNILQQRRSKALADAEARKQRLFFEHPVVKDLDEKLRSLRIDRLRAMRNKYDCSQIDANIENVKNKIDKYLTENGIEEDCLLPKFECSKCNDTGYVNAARCSCADKLIFECMYNDASLFGAQEQCFENFDLSVFEGEDEISQKQYADMKKIYAYCFKYAQGFSDDSPNLIFTGMTGTGKTFLSNCIAGTVLKKGHSVLAVSAYALVDMLRSASFNGTAELKRFYNVDLLVIDELGMEQIFSNITIEMLFMVINERYRRSLPIIINTNLTPQQMTQRYTERITSRLFDKEKSVVLKFDGHDIRLKRR